jgi:serine/threonine-protein kinase RsbW
LKLSRFGPCDAFPGHEVFTVREMRSPNRIPDSQAQFSRKLSRPSILEIDAWMSSRIHAISPQVDRLMRLIVGSQCVSGAEFDIQLAIREALGNAVVHGNQEDPGTRVPIRCRCEPGKKVSIVVRDQGKGFDFGKIVGNSLAADSAAEHGHGILLMKAYMDDVHFERGGSEVHMRKRTRNSLH